MNPSPIKLMLDEHVWKGLTRLLAEHGYDAVSIVDVNRSINDEPLLALATSEGRAVLTYNIKDFVPLAELWYEAGRDHAGIILSRQLPQGELVNRTLRLLEILGADEIHNNVRRLDDFK